jgi:hypothetical protein
MKFASSLNMRCCFGWEHLWSLVMVPEAQTCSRPWSAHRMTEWSDEEAASHLASGCWPILCVLADVKFMVSYDESCADENRRTSNSGVWVLLEPVAVFVLRMQWLMSAEFLLLFDNTYCFIPVWKRGRLLVDTKVDWGHSRTVCWE